MQALKSVSKKQLDELLIEMKKLNKDLETKIFVNNNISAIICPNFHHAAFKNENADILGGLLDY